MKTGKSNWSSPQTDYQTFVPQEYCESCFRYEVELYCSIANESGGTGYDSEGLPHQIASCGTSYVTVTVENGKVSYWGRESYNPDEAHQGRLIEVTNVNIPNILDLRQDSRFDYGTWRSEIDYNNRHLIFNHYGPGYVRVWEQTWPGHPNHS